MASFEVLNVRTESEVSYREISRDKSGKTLSYDVVETKKFKPGAYGHKNIKVGDVIEIKSDFLAGKARKNPDFSEVVDEAK